MTQVFLTRWKPTARRPYYLKQDEQMLDTNTAGQDVSQLAEAQASKRSAPTAWSFTNSIAGPDGNNKNAWKSATAVVLEYAASEDADLKLEEMNALHDTAVRLDHGFWLMTTQNRAGKPTISLVFPLVEAVTSADRYARLAAVLRDELYNLGLRGTFEHGCLAVTHLIHTNRNTGAVYHQAPFLNAKSKITLTKHQAQNWDKDKHTIGYQAAQAQLNRPEFTCEDGLFEW